MSEDEKKERSIIKTIVKFWKNTRLTFSLVRDYWKGDYRDVSFITIISIAATLLYMLLSPIAYIPVIGQIDDIIAIVICLKLIHGDLEKYKQYKEKELEDTSSH